MVKKEEIKKIEYTARVKALNEAIEVIVQYGEISVNLIRELQRLKYK